MNKHKQTSVPKLLAMAPLLAMALLLGSQASAAVTLLDKIAIVVDDDVIMVSEIEQRMQTIKAQRTRLPDDEALRAQIIERLIVESLQLQIAERSGVRVSDEDLNQALSAIAAQNRMTLEEFQAAVEQDGIAWPAMRNQVRREMSITRVQQGVMRRRINISEQEVEHFLASDLGEAITADEYRLGHILLALPDKVDLDEVRALKKKAEEILQQLEEGADFSTLAVEFSSDQNALEGGDMGWRKPAQLPTVFAGLVEDMQTGDVKGPIRSSRGFHLIKLQGRRGARAQGQIAQTQVRHVLVSPNEIRTASEAAELAESLREEITEEGRDFADIAKLYSDDPGSALSGGDLGWNSAGNFVPKFEEMMEKTAEGEVSPVFRTDHGFHFLEVTGRRTEDFSEQFKKNQAAHYLRNQKMDEELDSWLREIRSKAFVEVKI